MKIQVKLELGIKLKEGMLKSKIWKFFKKLNFNLI